tara:strand:+ start:75 stop:428 length:354 start_codon:yes stop_codon:yes gene_type:complete
MYETTDQHITECIQSNEMCLRPVNCGESCDELICTPIKNGFQLDSFNPISHISWIHYGSLDDKNSPTAHTNSSEFNTEEKLKLKIEERKKHGHEISSNQETDSHSSPPEDKQLKDYS